MNNLQERLARSPADAPNVETLQSALHWLTAHAPPPELQDLVATLRMQTARLIEQDRSIAA
jgi:hypothetical protein